MVYFSHAHEYRYQWWLGLEILKLTDYALITYHNVTDVHGFGFQWLKPREEQLPECQANDKKKKVKANSDAEDKDSPLHVTIHVFTVSQACSDSPLWNTVATTL